MFKWPRLFFQRTSGWYRSTCLVVISVVLSTAQHPVPQDPNRIDNKDSDVRNQRESMRELRTRIMRQTGRRVWNAIEETGNDLPLFGIQHDRNRRKLNTLQLVHFEQEGKSPYAVGGGEVQARSSVGNKDKSQNGANDVNEPARRRRPARPAGTTSNPKSSKSSGMGHPSPPPPRPPNSQPTSSQPACIVELNFDFLQLSAIPPALLLDPNNPDEQALGTRYVYNDGLRDHDTLDELIGSRASGICTRVQARVGNADIGLQLGRGQCHFTYALRDSRNREIIFTATGDVVDSLGGVLSITGGSQTTVGAFGEIELLPVNLVGNGKFEVEAGDFFLDPLFYSADARVYVPCDL